MNNIANKQIIFVGGKGGVGKSTTSAAIALANANSGYKTLIVSTDPAHNTGDIFHTKLGFKKKKILDNLWGIEIDSSQEVKRYISSVKENLKGLVKTSMHDEVHRQIDLASASPGAEEAALFDRLMSIILNELEHFDKIIFDTAPTGHTIRLLTLPELMTAWIDGMLQKRKKINDNYVQLLNDGEPIEDPIYEKLNERKNKFVRVREIILNEEKTGFIFVLNPERLPIIETEQAIQQLQQYNIHVRTIIVNKVIPEEANGTFIENRRLSERKYLQLIDERFNRQKIVRIPLFDQDISNKEQLMNFSKYVRNIVKEEVL